MRIKSYYAPSTEDAIAAARQELGPEAMLVHSRRTPVETRHLGECEVVFATDVPGEEAEAGWPHASRTGSEGENGHLAADLEALKKDLESMRRTFAQTAFGPARWAGASASASDAFSALIAGEVSADLARDIVQAAESRSAPRPDGATLQQALVEEIQSRIRVEALLGRGAGTPRIVALVGPPGTGKTTTLVKLAVTYGLAARRPVTMFTMDTYRVAAAEQLRSYAGILGVGFQIMETVTALAQAIEENRGKELIFIDTPGLAVGEAEYAPGLARFLSTRSDIDTELVLSCSTKPADLKRMIDEFEIFRPQRLIFTMLDETGSFGPILNEAVRTAKALSFFANGQRIPEDLETASGSRLAELILSAPAAAVRSAA